jgi:hypothetical protein
MNDVDRQLSMPTRFNSENETEASVSWNSIEAGHGEVSIDPDWAATRGFPPSMTHPLNPDKMVCTIAAYQAINCLVTDLF